MNNTKGAFVHSTTGKVLAGFVDYQNKQSLQSQIYLQDVQGPSEGKLLDLTAYNADQTVTWVDDPDYVTKKAKEQAILDRNNSQLIGFDYKGDMVSFTKVDRDAVMQANAAFEKRDMSDNLYVSGATKLPISFENGTELSMTRTEFNTDFFPVFFAKGLADVKDSQS